MLHIFVSCEICLQLQNIINMYVRNSISPAIAIEEGTKYRLGRSDRESHESGISLKDPLCRKTEGQELPFK